MLAAYSFAGAQTQPCELGLPRFEVKEGKQLFQIEIACQAGSAGPAYPVGVALVVGLTLYRGSDAAARSAADEQSTGDVRTARQEKPNPAGRKRTLLRDQDGPSYDFPVKDLVVSRGFSRAVLRFEATPSDVAAYPYWLFAVWRKDSVRPCDRKDAYARSGCARYGYVIGDSDVQPVDQYPGLEVTQIQHPAGDWRSERWLVERFR